MFRSQLLWHNSVKAESHVTLKSNVPRLSAATLSRANYPRAVESIELYVRLVPGTTCRGGPEGILADAAAAVGL